MAEVKIQGRLYPVDFTTKTDTQPDAIRCQHPETIGPLTQRCSFIKNEKGMAEVWIGPRHYLIPIPEVQFIVLDAYKQGLHDEKPV